MLINVVLRQKNVIISNFDPSTLKVLWFPPHSKNIDTNLQLFPRFMLFFEHFFQFLGNRGPYSQSTMHDFDPISGVVFYCQVHLNGIGCWNSNTEHTENNFHMIASNNQTMMYPVDMNVSTLATSSCF